MNLGHFPEASPQALSQLIHLLRPWPVVRYLNWQQTNYRTDHRRPRVEHPSHLPVLDNKWMLPRGAWGRYPGVPTSVIARMAQALGHRPWLCFWHTARLETIEQVLNEFARRGIRPIVQYGNEVWNGSFEAYHYAVKHYPLVVSSRPDLDSRSTALLWECHQANAIADQFGHLADVVIGAQFWAPETVELVLDHAGANITAIAAAPYIGHKVDQLEFALAIMHGLPAARGLPNESGFLKDNIRKSAQDARNLIATYVEQASRKGKRLYAYEGGLHLAAYRREGESDQAFQARAFAVVDYNRSEQAGNDTRELWRGWRDEGGGIACPYSLSTRPSNTMFGHVEITNNGLVTLPKYQAALDVLVHDR